MDSGFCTQLDVHYESSSVSTHMGCAHSISHLVLMLLKEFKRCTVRIIFLIVFMFTTDILIHIHMKSYK